MLRSRPRALSMCVSLLLATACNVDFDDPASSTDGGPDRDGGPVGDGDDPTPGDGDGPTPGDGDGPTPGDGDNPTPGDGDNPTPGDGDGPTPGDGDGDEDAGPDTGMPTPECQEGTCCVGGTEYLEGAENPSNSCQACDPSQSTTGFSPRENGTCGTGCECNEGEPKELACNDGEDNDADDNKNCADVDCTSQLCRDFEAVKIYPSKDVRNSISSMSSSDMTLEGEKSMLINVATMSESNVRFEFENIPGGQGVKISSAQLAVWVETPEAKLALHGPDNLAIETKTLGTSAGFMTFDITALAKKWADGTETRRFVLLRPGAFGKTVYVRATESDAVMFDPNLGVSYEGYCHAGKCPSL